MSKATGYEDQHGCHDCANVFLRSDYAEGDSYFCCDDAPPRPPCCSVEMEEYDLEAAMREIDDDGPSQDDVWDAWAEDREVNPWGICDAWEEVEP